MEAEVAMAYFNVLFRNFSAVTEEARKSLIGMGRSPIGVRTVCFLAKARAVTTCTLLIVTP